MILGVILMRVVLLVGLAGTLWALPRLVKHLGGKLPVALWLAVASPMMVIHLFGGPHNDLMMLAFLTIGVLAALERKHVLAVVLVTIGMLIKPTAAIALPFIVWMWANHLTGEAEGPQLPARRRGVGGPVPPGVRRGHVDLARLAQPRLVVRAQGPAAHRELAQHPHRHRRGVLQPRPPDRRRPGLTVRDGRPRGGHAPADRLRRPPVVARPRRRHGGGLPGRHLAAGGGDPHAADPAVVPDLGFRAPVGVQVAAAPPGARGGGVGVRDAGVLPDGRAGPVRLVVHRPGRSWRACTRPRRCCARTRWA